MDGNGEDEDDVFIYNGVDEVPEDVTHVSRVDQTVTIIPQSAFLERHLLVRVELPEGLIKIENRAFYDCKSLKSVNILSTVQEICVKS